MTLGLSVIGLTVALLVLAARLGDTQRQLAEARRESAEQARRAREEQAVYQYGTAALALLLADLIVSGWPAPRAQARPARFRAGAGSRGPAADREAGR